MYRLAAADDNPDVIHGMESVQDWHDCGVRYVGSAGNGRDALTLVMEQDVDILIADIRMPVMSGLDVTREVKLLHPGTRVILLSAFTEFAYAQEAMRLGADEYLAKPVRLGEIKEAVRRAVGKLEADDERRRLTSNLQEQASIGATYERLQLLRRVLHASADKLESGLRARAGELGFPVSDHRYLVAIIDSDDPSAAGEETSIRIASVAEKLCPSVAEAAPIIDDPTRVAIVFSAPVSTEGAALQTLVRGWAFEVRDEIRREYSVQVSIAIGTGQSDLLALSRSLKDAGTVLGQRFHLGRGVIVDCRESSGSARFPTAPYPIDLERDLLAALHAGTAMNVRSLLAEYVERLREASRTDALTAVTCWRGMLQEVSKLLLESQLDESTVLDSRVSDMLKTMITIDDFHHWAKNAFPRICDAIANRSAFGLTTQIAMAKRFILEHLEEPITIGRVATHVGLSPNYLASVFKQLTGSTIHESIVAARIDRAKELLTGNRYRVAEIAERTGYHDVRHFSLLFKTRVGLTPKRYQQNARKVDAAD